MPKLPGGAGALGAASPISKTACACWIHAGGAHHTGFSQAVTTRDLEDFAAIADVEFLLIGEGASVFEFKQELRWNEVYHALNRGWAV